MSKNGNNQSGPLQTGTVKMFDDTRGYGFITLDDGTGDMFFHRNNAVNPERDRNLSFKPKTRVEFTVTRGEKGLKAVGVKQINL
jgi:CspA family cold shock protein